MYKDQIYDEREFKTKYEKVYSQTVKEFKKSAIDIKEYYFSQYLTSVISNTETVGMLTYILDDGTDDTSYYIEFTFNENDEIINISSELDID